MSLDDLIAQDAALFVDPVASTEVESIEYRPRGGTAVTLSVQVFRKAASEMNGSIVIGTQIFVRRHATLGRESIDVGGDKVLIAKRRGQTPELHRVAGIVQEDAGGFTLHLE
jgi:hypothetical protein